GARGRRYGLDVRATRRERPGELGDVDVHATGVTAPRLVEGGGVHRQHRHAGRVGKVVHHSIISRGRDARARYDGPHNPRRRRRAGPRAPSLALRAGREARAGSRPCQITSTMHAGWRSAVTVREPSGASTSTSWLDWPATTTCSPTVAKCRGHPPSG